MIWTWMVVALKVSKQWQRWYVCRSKRLCPACEDLYILCFTNPVSVEDEWDPIVSKAVASHKIEYDDKCHIPIQAIFSSCGSEHSLCYGVVVDILSRRSMGLIWYTELHLRIRTDLLLVSSICMIQMHREQSTVASSWWFFIIWDIARQAAFSEPPAHIMTGKGECIGPFCKAQITKWRKKITGW